MPGYNNTYKDNLILVISADHKGAKNAIAELNDYLMATQKAMAVTAGSTASTTTEIKKQEKAIDNHGRKTSKSTSGQQKFSASIASTSHSFRRLTANMTTGNTALDTLSMRLDRASMFMWRFNIAMIPLQQIEFQLAAIAGGMIMLEKAAVETYRRAERMRTTFIGMGDSASEAEKKVDFLLEKAKELPFTFTEVTNAAMAFRTAGLADTTEEMERWIDAAADMAAAATTDVGHNIATAAEAMVDAVNGEIRRLRNTYHVSSEEMAKFGDDAKEALFALIESKWGGVAEAQMVSLEGKLSNFIDSLTRLGVAFGENLKEPLMLILGLGEKVVDTITAVVKALGSLGGGAAIIGVLIPLLGILVSRIIMTYIQIQGLKGGYKILTRNVGSLYTVMSQLAESMNRLAIAEADEIAATGALNSSLTEQLGIRNALSKAISEQARVTAAEARAQYSRSAQKFTTSAAGGAAYGKGGPLPGASMQGQFPIFTTPIVRPGAQLVLPGMGAGGPQIPVGYGGRYSEPGFSPGAPGASSFGQLRLPGMGTTGIGTVSRDVTGLALATAKDMGVPVSLFEQYARRTGKAIQELTKAEILLLAETAERVGILETEAVATAASASANKAKAASEQAVMDNIAKNILLQKKFEQFGFGGIFGGMKGIFKGGVSGLFDAQNWSNVLTMFQRKFLDARLAINSTSGAIATFTAAIMAVGYAFNKISSEMKNNMEEIDNTVNEHLSNISYLESNKQMTAIQAEVAKEELEKLQAEEKVLQQQRHNMALLQTFLFWTPFNIPIDKWMKENEKQLMAIEDKMANVYNERAKDEAREVVRRGGGYANYMGRIVGGEDIEGAIARMNQFHANGRVVYSWFSKAMQEADAEMKRLQVMEKKGLNVTDELTAATIKYNTMLVQEAKDRRAMAIATKDEQGMLQAEQDMLIALTAIREANIDAIGRELNAADSHMGYLKQMGIYGEEYETTLKEQYNAHKELAAIYKKSGDEAKYWQHMLSMAQLSLEYNTYAIDRAIEAQERHIMKLRAERAAQWELYEAELARYKLANERAAKQSDPAKKEQEQIDALERMQSAYERLMDERAALAGALASRTELQSAAEDKALDPAVIAARRRAALAERDAAAARGSEAEVINAENKLLQIEQERVKALEDMNEKRAKNRVDVQDAYYQLSTVMREHQMISQRQADAIKNQYINILQDRIRKETDVAERIRMQTELIRLQAKEAENSYDSIIRRIIGGPEAVDQAISLQMMARRFGPGPASPMSAFRVVGRNRDTLTIELGPNTADRLRQAVSGAASEAFIRSFIEELVTRLRS